MSRTDRLLPLLLALSCHPGKDSSSLPPGDTVDTRDSPIDSGADHDSRTWAHCTVYTDADTDGGGEAVAMSRVLLFERPSAAGEPIDTGRIHDLTSAIDDVDMGAFSTCWSRSSPA